VFIAVVLLYELSAVEIAVFIAVVLLYELSAVEIAVFIAVVLLYELSAVEIAVFIVVVLLYELKSTVGDAKVPSIRRKSSSVLLWSTPNNVYRSEAVNEDPTFSQFPAVVDGDAARTYNPRLLASVSSDT
jgi:hypothetical protein